MTQPTRFWRLVANIPEVQEACRERDLHPSTHSIVGWRVIARRAAVPAPRTPPKACAESPPAHVVLRNADEADGRSLRASSEPKAEGQPRAPRKRKEPENPGPATEQKRPTFPAAEATSLPSSGSKGRGCRRRPVALCRQRARKGTRSRAHTRHQRPCQGPTLHNGHSSSSNGGIRLMPMWSRCPITSGLVERSEFAWSGTTCSAHDLPATKGGARHVLSSACFMG